ncbi:discoidin domain-containing protein [Kineococcus terrestris]|uniref:discoidin domain-containing protein n=1 Tax=Kineococcus terrestris TaxID=2044856 RepID=UPI0034DB62D1
MRPGDRFCWTCGHAPGRTRTGTGGALGTPAPAAPGPAERRRPGAGPVLVLAATAVAAAAVVSLWSLARAGADATAAESGAPVAPPAAAGTTPTTAPGTAPAKAPATAPARVATAPAAPAPPGPAAPLRELAVAAAPRTSPDSVDAGGARTRYAAANLLDGDPSTAWRADGDAAGEALTFRFDSPRRLSEVGLVNGLAKTDPHDGTDRYPQNRRVLEVAWSFDGGPAVRQELVDGERGVQLLALAPVEVREVTLVLTGTSAAPAGAPDRTALGEVHLAGP